MEARGREQRAVFRPDRLALNEFVARELLADKAVVGPVPVERVDHVVAVAPEAGQVAIVFESFGFGVADDIEPVLGGPFAMLGACQQAVDEAFPSARRGIVEERGDLVRRWRQASHVEIDPPRQGRAVGPRGGSQAVVLESPQHEGVDGVDRPSGIRSGNSDFGAGLEGPVSALLVAVLGRLETRGRQRYP